MIDDTVNSYFDNWSLPKDVYIDVYTDETEQGELLTEFTNDNINDDSLLLRESINDSDNVEFIGCIPTRFEIAFRDLNKVADSLKDRPVSVKIKIPIENGQEYTIPIFSGYVDSCVKQNEIYYKIVCYDYLYKMSNIDVSAWYAELGSSFTVKQFRDSLCTFLGITQATKTLPNDSVTVNKASGTVQLTALDAIKAVCQINGVFGRFEYNESTDTFDKGYIDYLTIDSTAQSEATIGWNYQSLEAETYTVHRINTVIVRGTESEVYPGRATNKGQDEDENTYIIQGNILLRGLFGVDVEQFAILNTLASNLLTQVNKLPAYTPFTAVSIGYPTVESGDLLTFSQWSDDTETTASLTPFTHTLKGIQAIKSEFSAQGERFQTLTLSDLSQDISAIAAATEANTQWITAADNGTNERLNNTIKTSAKQEAAKVITQSADTMIESLVTHITAFALQPNIVQSGDNWEWSAGHDTKTFTSTSQQSYRNYINIADTTVKQLYEDLIVPASYSNIAEADTTLLTINGSQVYYTDLSNFSAGFSMVSPRTSNPSMSSYIEDMYKVRRLASASTGSWLWNTFGTVSKNGTETIIDTGITFGDVAEIHYKKTSSEKYLDLRMQDTNGVYRGIRIKDDGVYYTQDGTTYALIGGGSGGGGDSPIGTVKIIDGAITAADIEDGYNVYVAYDPSTTPYIEGSGVNILQVTSDNSGHGVFVMRAAPEPQYDFYGMQRTSPYGSELQQNTSYTLEYIGLYDDGTGEKTVQLDPSKFVYGTISIYGNSGELEVPPEITLSGNVLTIGDLTSYVEEAPYGGQRYTYNNAHIAFDVDYTPHIPNRDDFSMYIQVTENS